MGCLDLDSQPCDLQARTATLVLMARQTGLPFLCTSILNIFKWRTASCQVRPSANPNSRETIVFMAAYAEPIQSASSDSGEITRMLLYFDVHHP